jgi:Tol biopolymer transport system component
MKRNETIDARPHREQVIRANARSGLLSCNQRLAALATLLIFPGAAAGSAPAAFVGKVVLFGTHAPDMPQPSLIQTINPDGTDLTTVFEWRDGSITGGRVSPDGRLLAFSVRRDRGDPQIWVLEPSGKARKIAERGFITACSPNGSRLAYVRTEGEGFANFVLDVQAGKVERLLIPGTDLVNDWSPRGDVLTVLAGHPDRSFTHPEKGNYPLRQIDLTGTDGMNRRPLTTDSAQDNLWSRFSPDGSLIAHYRRHPQNVPRIYEFAVVRASDGSNPRDVLRFGDLDPERSIRPLDGPCWSPDGKMIAWPVTERKRDGSESRFEIVFIPLDGTAPRRLPTTPLGVSWAAAIDWR